ncbi:PREDICTED: U-box domain-containing protein 21-like [Ipomoea nil]|uniref:U-box domain-containing protein 21-like n=1 Tax=Ipomoea nil TaxID=35883 RepID=UPI000901A7D8|nr:PREDICTED: U-box domain-containing protein 21-like [Ipomoea nil]
MFFSRRILGRVGRGGRKKKVLRIGSRREMITPTHFLCPISLDLMKDPVTLSTGISYDRENIEKWLGEGNRTCPVTNQELTSYDLIPNHAIRRMIQEWCVDNRSHGIERIPTPRIPVSSSEVSEMCARLEAATGRGDHQECLELLGKMKGLAKESERDKKCIAESGAGRVLSACFQAFSTENKYEVEDLVKEVLSALKWMFPVGEESKSMLGSKPSLRCMAWILKGQDSSAKRNVVIVLKKLLSLDHTYANILAQVDEDVPQALFEMVKSPTCPSARKAPLEVIYRMVASSPEANGKFVKMGLPSLVLEILVDAEKGVAEKALAVLDGICESQEGRDNICSHPLTMALLVKKIMRLSEMGTELCVSIMWKLLCKGEDENQVVEALELGGFQKLLVVLQVGCGENTKERATELLKLMNLYQDRVQCLHNSSGFKYLKKSY